MNETAVAPRVRRWILGEKRELAAGTFHKVSLVSFLAWVGLGADGLSSSAYGPEEAFRALGTHTVLALPLAIATALTVLVIAVSYSRIIEQFPFGGGGYVVASKLLGVPAGVTSGSALVIDYVLTISISVAAAADAFFSLLPADWSTGGGAKLGVAMFAIALLVLLNLRGVRESVTLLTPIFLLFLVTHALLIGGVILGEADGLPALANELQADFDQALGTGPEALGLAGVLALLLRAYTMGAGTYTGIEAVSNGLAIMREPKVQTGKRTMALMATSLAVTAGGLILAYLLADVQPVEGRTMNAVLAATFSEGLHVKGVHFGPGFLLATLVSEAALLVVAAQAGFLDGPRVMANMAGDSFLPHRFRQLSDRLTMHYGVLLMGGSAAAALWYTGGSVRTLVVMYSINVFVTFSLSQLAMCRFWLRDRAAHPNWRRNLALHSLAFALCAFILAATVHEKFLEGGWVTVVVTALLIALCFVIRRHYRSVETNLRRLDAVADALPRSCVTPPPPLDPEAPTAVLLVSSFAGLGIHTLLSIQRLFPGHFRNFVFVAVGVIDSASFTNVRAVDELREHTKAELDRYLDLAARLGFPAEGRMAVDTEVSAPAIAICEELAQHYRRPVFFAGKLVFQRERWYQRLLHNETAYQLQRSLQFAGLNAMVLPTRVLETAA